MKCGDHKCPDRVDLRYVRDERGIVWRLAHDDGMVNSVGYDGQMYSAGIVWLEKTHGPLERFPYEHHVAG